MIFHTLFLMNFFNKDIGLFDAVFVLLDVYAILLDICDAEGSRITIYTFLGGGYYTKTICAVFCIVFLLADNHM